MAEKDSSSIGVIQHLMRYAANYRQARELNDEMTVFQIKKSYRVVISIVLTTLVNLAILVNIFQDKQHSIAMIKYD